jgi:CDP-ribitol ribitolphosphotransferase
MTHDGSSDGNVGTMVEYLKERKEGYSFHYIRKSDRKMAKSFLIMKGKVSFFITKPYHLATSQFVLMDNIFLPMAYLKFSKKVRVIQLWHGTGTIKRFGQDVNTGRLKLLEKRVNNRVTHLIVNSEITENEYAQAFGIESGRIFTYGLPRTDLFFNKEKMEERKSKFYKQYPQLAGKKLILYAPTFRDQEKDNPKLALNPELLCSRLPKDFILLLRLHPYVMELYKKHNTVLNEENVISMSSYPDVNTLLLVADCLITDYSSVIFEYCLLQRPMIFYAYDLDEFSDRGRGFYQPYEKYVPGPIARETQEIADLLNKSQFDYDKIRDFVKLNYKYLDGKAAERIYEHIFKGQV